MVAQNLSERRPTRMRLPLSSGALNVRRKMRAGRHGDHFAGGPWLGRIFPHRTHGRLAVAHPTFCVPNTIEAETIVATRIERSVARCAPVGAETVFWWAVARPHLSKPVARTARRGPPYILRTKRYCSRPLFRQPFVSWSQFGYSTAPSGSATTSAVPADHANWLPGAS